MLSGPNLRDMTFYGSYDHPNVVDRFSHPEDEESYYYELQIEDDQTDMQMEGGQISDQNLLQES